MKTFPLTISSPDGDIFKGEVMKLDVRGLEGELAVMAGHVPFVTAIKKAPCKIWLDEETVKHGFSEGGILSVDTDRVTLISGSFKFE